MPVDHSAELRAAIVEHLRGNAGVIAITPRIWGEQPPANPYWPFVRYGLPFLSSFEATGWSGSEHDVTLHSFARDNRPVNGGPGIEGNVQIAALNKAIVAALDDVSLPLDIGLVSIDWLDTQVIRDSDEASAYHGILRFRVVTVQ